MTQVDEKMIIRLVKHDTLKRRAYSTEPKIVFKLCSILNVVAQSHPVTIHVYTLQFDEM